MRKLIEQGIAHVGPQAEVAKRMRDLGGKRQQKISQAHVSYWLKVGRIPTEHIPTFCRACDGVVKAAQLDPETFGGKVAA